MQLFVCHEAFHNQQRRHSTVGLTASRQPIRRDAMGAHGDRTVSSALRCPRSDPNCATGRRRARTGPARPCRAGVRPPLGSGVCGGVSRRRIPRRADHIHLSHGDCKSADGRFLRRRHGAVRRRGAVVPSETPRGAAAMTTHYDDYGRLSEANAAILAWCRANDRLRAGLSWEMYGHWHADFAQLHTEICYLL